MSTIPLTEDDLHDLYLWVDDIPLSRPKRNIARDFADGVCVAEVVKHFFPKLVELHNYSSANSVSQKIANWNTLNTRVFQKLHFEVPKEEVRDIVAAVPGAIERFLRALRTKIAQIKSIQHSSGSRARGQHDADGALADPIDTDVVDFPRSKNPPRPQPQPQPAPPPGPAAPSGQSLRQLLDEKDRAIFELKETVALLNEKVAKLEDLIRIKDNKINAYKQRLGH